MPYKRTLNIIFLIIIPLLSGGIIYLIGRDNSIYFKKLLGISFEQKQLDSWIKFNLPDGLWAFSLSSTLCMIWKWKYSKNYLIWLIIISIIALSFEIFFGTFDFIDIIFILVGIFIPLTYIEYKRNNYEQKTI